jgi:predicted TPR repeat methyltransferase
MSNWPPDWLRDYPAGVQDAFDAALRGSLAAPIVLTRLFLLLGDAALITALLARVETQRRDAGDQDGAARISAISALARHNSAAFAEMRDVLAILHGDSAPAPADIAALAAAFDLAAQRSPAASVALYSLGDSALLDAATNEVVALLRERSLVSSDTRVLEIGCGIGRFAEALAARVKSFAGIDLSKNMIAIARDRCAEMPNVTFSVTAGHDLTMHGDASFDLVLAVDSFPYIVAAGADLTDVHISESARVLAPGGGLAIFNFSYQDDFEGSRERLRHLGQQAGLHLVTSEAAPLRSWDGSFFQLQKPTGSA